MILWSGVLVVCIVAGFLIALAVKKSLRENEPPGPADAAGFTLSDLRQLHRDGQLTDEEFDKAKGKIVAASKRATERDSQKRQAPPV